jgi:hypothetical protein
MLLGMRFLRFVIVVAFVGLGVVVAEAQKGPPPAAFDACAKLKAGDKCSFKGRKDTDVSGTCQTAKDASKGLVCRRDGMGSGGKGSGSGSGKGSGSGSGSGKGSGSGSGSSPGKGSGSGSGSGKGNGAGTGKGSGAGSGSAH